MNTSGELATRRLMGARLRELREDADLSQLELAKLSGVAQASISNWERGARTIPADALLRVVRACCERDPDGWAVPGTVGYIVAGDPEGVRA